MAVDESKRQHRVLNVVEKERIKQVKDVIGQALDKIGAYANLNNKEQVVAMIDEVC